MLSFCNQQRQGSTKIRVLWMEKAGVMPLPPYEWQSCHFCSHMLVYPADVAELYKGPVFAEKYACMEKTL